MAAKTGSALYLTFGGVVLDTDYRTFSTSEEMGIVDASAGADANRTYLTTLKDGTASLTIVVQADDTATWAAVVPGTSGTLLWGDEGTATAGNPRSYAWATVTGRERSMEYADLVVADISWQLNGAVTDSTY